MIRGWGRRLPGWAWGVFALALAVRVAFILVVDQPLLYTHQYTYFTGAMSIVEHPHPLRYVVTSEDWRTWDVHWTIAPLYYLFVAAVFLLCGPHLRVLQLIQAVLDAGVAVCAAWLGRRAAGPRGAWAGVAYAFYLPAVEISSWTMTENLHTPLLVLGLTLAVREAERPAGSRALVAGVVTGLSALTRSVGSVLVGLVPLWRLWRERPAWRDLLTLRPWRVLPGWRSAVLFAVGGLLTILPWTARNVFVIGDPIPIESTAYENIWWSNHFSDARQHYNQTQVIASLPTPAAKRAAALHFALRGIRRSPFRLVTKTVVNFWHFLRPEGLQGIVFVERAIEPWRHLALLLGDDLLTQLALPGFVLFLLAGRPSPVRGLIAVWTTYYLFMITVVFANEVRYRSAMMPFVFAGAVAGWGLLRDPARGRLRTTAAFALGAVLVGRSLLPFVGPGLLQWRAYRLTGSAIAALEKGDEAGARAQVEEAAALYPESSRPWFDWGQALFRSGRVEAAAEAYLRGQKVAKPTDWRGAVALPRVLEAAGRTAEAEKARRTLVTTSYDTDPWLVLKCAWRELPPPRTNDLRLAEDDYGAVQGFSYPRGLDPELTRHRLEWTHWEDLDGPHPPPGPHRWSRDRAEIRLIPADDAPRHDVTLDMGVPFPSTLGEAAVTVRADGEPPVTFKVDAQVRPYTLRAPTPPGKALHLTLRAPTWSRLGEPAAQGVRVDRVTLTPVP